MEEISRIMSPETELIIFIGALTAIALHCYLIIRVGREARSKQA
jgi:hypothetical protein